MAWLRFHQSPSPEGPPLCGKHDGEVVCAKESGEGGREREGREGGRALMAMAQVLLGQ